MALPATTTDITKIAEVFRTEYKQANNGVWVLTVEGDHPDLASKATLEEFRENNRRLFAEKQALEGKLAEAEKLKQEKEALEKKDKESGNKVDQLAAQVSALLEEDKRNKSEIQKARVSEKLRVAALAKGVKPEAAPDLLAIVAGDWVEENGVPVRKVNGNTVLSQKRPGEPESPEEYFEALAKVKSHFYSMSVGDGPPASIGIRTLENGKTAIDLEQLDPIARGRALELIREGKAVLSE